MKLRKLMAISFAALMGLSCSMIAMAEEEPIKVAFVGPLTGDYSEYGISFQAALQIAVDEANEAGGVLGRQVEVVSYDDKNDPNEAAAIAEMIADDDSICSVFGHFSSGVAMTAAQTYQEVGVVLMSASASHMDYSSIGDYIFRNNVTTDIETANDMQIAIISGVKRLGILKLKTDWGDSAETATLAAYEQIKDKADIELVHSEDYEDGTVDYSSFVSKFIDAECDGIIVIGSYQNMAAFAKQYKQLNPDIKLIAQGNLYTPELINLGGDAVNGVLFPCGMDPTSDDPAVQAFVKAYSEKNDGKLPDNMAAQTYDNAKMVFEAIERAGTADREAIKDELYNTDYEGVSGHIRFNEIGDAQKTQNLFTVEDGQFVSDPGALKEWNEFVASLG